MKRLLIIIPVLFIISCESYKEPRKCKIRQYQTGSDANNDLLYWYLMFNSHTHSYYYYSSPAPVSNFANISWEQSNAMPAQLNDLQPTAEIEEPLTELPNEIEVEMEAEPDQGQTESTENSSNESSPESSSESSSGRRLRRLDWLRLRLSGQRWRLCRPHGPRPLYPVR